MNNPLFLVHTMGRVGSVSVHEALLRVGYQSALFHRRLDQETGEPSELWQNIQKWPGDLVVITMLRDPVERNISAYFLNYLELDQEPTVQDFLFRYPQQVPNEWVAGELGYWIPQLEIGPIGGNDFTTLTPYPHDLEGNLHLIILKTTELDAQFEVAFQRTTGLKPPKLAHRGQTRRRQDYQEFLRTAKFPAGYLEEMYEQPWVRFFFNPWEIDGWYDRWSK